MDKPQLHMGSLNFTVASTEDSVLNMHTSLGTRSWKYYLVVADLV
jgi:hypothetical protein